MNSQIPTDNVSLNLGDKTGLTFCGDRKFEIVKLDSHSSYLDWSGNVLTL